MQRGLPRTPESSPSPRRNLTEKPSEGSGAAQPFSTSTFSGFILSICQREGRKRAPSQMAAREIPASQPAQARCPSEAGRGTAPPGPPWHQEQSGAAEARPAGSGINAANTASGTVTYPWVFIDQKAPKSFPRPQQMRASGPRGRLVPCSQSLPIGLMRSLGHGVRMLSITSCSTTSTQTPLCHNHPWQSPTRTGVPPGHSYLSPKVTP